LFDRDGHSFVPTWAAPERRAQGAVKDGRLATAEGGAQRP